MSHAAIARKAGTHAAVHYVTPSPEALYCYASAPLNGQPESNIAFEEHTVGIADVRATGSPLLLNTDGATLLSQRSRFSSFDDEDEIREKYYPEAADIIRTVTGAHQVVVFDHNLRVGGTGTANEDARRPVFHAHVDFTERSARCRAREVVGPMVDSVRRLVSINLWRPIAEPVRDSPLAICLSPSVDSEDLVPAELRYENRTGEIYYLAHNPRHSWLYAPEMRTHEFWLFKNSDSSMEGRGRVTPHSAFIDGTVPANVPPRESLEVRAFALFH